MRHEKKTHANELLSSSPISPLSKNDQNVEKPVGAPRHRWRHVSSPSVSTASPTSSITPDIEMTDLPVRIRAMSTSASTPPPGPTLGGPTHRGPPPLTPISNPPPPRLDTTTTDAPLFDETSLKYLESQLSPESLLMEDTTASEDDNAWLMSDLMIKKENPEASPASPPETPDPASLSPPLGGLYGDPDPPGNTTPIQAKMSRCDLLTRTKNPVLPSVYIDNSLIVPEPSKQKYHITQGPGLIFNAVEHDEDDYFEAFMSDKETLFPV